MNNTVAVFVVVLCFSAVLSLDSSGFRPSKKIQNHHMRHSVHQDLEKVASSVKADKAESSKSEIDVAMKDLEAFEQDFLQVKKDILEIKKHAKKAEPATHSQDSFEASDDAALLEVQSLIDDMNDGVEDDDTVAPMVANRMRSSLLQHSTKGPNDDSGITIGVASDGSKRTFDVAKDGSTKIAPAPEYPDFMVKPNDAKYRDPNDPTLAIVPVANVPADTVAVNSDMPGTMGKQWSVQAEQNAPADNDVVCVCKRHGAPRGEDRVRCKRHETPTPSPTPTPTPVKGIRQCANGTWPSNAFPDAETTDIICIYYPSQIETIPAPTPQPTPTREYPDECYDSRNEFVAEGVEKRLFDAVLLQQGFHTCGC